MREIIYDRRGRAIYLTDERWEHILEFHPEMAALREELRATLRHGRRTQEPLDPSVYVYCHSFPSLPGNNTHIVAIAKFSFRAADGEEANNFVLTAYPKIIYSQR